VEEGFSILNVSIGMTIANGIGFRAQLRIVTIGSRNEGRPLPARLYWWYLRTEFVDVDANVEFVFVVCLLLKLARRGQVWFAWCRSEGISLANRPYITAAARLAFQASSFLTF
jgi:hypothetical protein